MHDPMQNSPNMSGPKPADIRKKGSFRSLFSRFRRSSKEETQVETPYYAATDSSSSASMSTMSLPSDVRFPAELPQDRQSDPSSYEQTLAPSGPLPSGISAPFSRTPSSSSSSTSSVDYGSETSTPITTPSNSSPSILMKVSDSALDASPVQEAQHYQAEPVSYQESAHNARRSPRNAALHRKQPSPLSTVTGVHAPYNTGSPKSPEPRTSGRNVSSKRRNSISRLLVRRTKSTPDLTLSDDDDDDIPPIPSLPQSAPTSRPTSATSTASAPSLGRKFSLLRRPSTSSRPSSMAGESSGDINLSKEEHLLILGADPSGPGFYLYPTSKQEQMSRRKSAVGPPGRQMNRWSVEDYKRRSWSGAEQAAYDNGGGHMTGAPPRRGRPGMRGPSFRGNVANQVIIEESAEGYESPVMGMRRHSGVPRGYENWPQSWIEIENQPTVSDSKPPQYTSIDDLFLVGPESRAGFGVETVRRPSRHNTWDHITAYVEKCNHGMSSLAVPVQKRQIMDSGTLELDEEEMLRELQSSAVNFMHRSSRALQEEESGGSTHARSIPGIPIIRVELVDI